MTIGRVSRGPSEADGIFERLCKLCDGLDDGEAAATMARLCVIFAHHIGDLEVIDEAVRIARGDLEGGRQRR